MPVGQLALVLDVRVGEVVPLRVAFPGALRVGCACVHLHIQRDLFVIEDQRRLFQVQADGTIKMDIDLLAVGDSIHVCADDTFGADAFMCCSLAGSNRRALLLMQNKLQEVGASASPLESLGRCCICARKTLRAEDWIVIAVVFELSGPSLPPPPCLTPPFVWYSGDSLAESFFAPRSHAFRNWRWSQAEDRFVSCANKSFDFVLTSGAETLAEGALVVTQISRRTGGEWTGGQLLADGEVVATIPSEARQREAIHVDAGRVAQGATIRWDGTGDLRVMGYFAAAAEE
jgi:hypothetical protein